MYVIYLHTNKITSKSYIGYTQYSMEKRFRNHCAYARSGSTYLFHRAIRKYGEDMWESSILEQVCTLSEAKTAEIKHIADRKTYGRDTGYNMTAGGEGSACIGRILSSEHREKVIAALKRARKPTKEEYRLRGLARQGEKRSNAAVANITAGMIASRAGGNTDAQISQLKALHKKTTGTKRSQETKDKISEALSGKKRKNKMSTEQITEMLESKLTRIELAEYYGVNVSTISSYRKEFGPKNKKYYQEGA